MAAEGGFVPPLSIIFFSGAAAKCGVRAFARFPIFPIDFYSPV